ncbi:MAG: CooT family nickel-binding protein [Clostridiales bacterium]
MCEANVYLRETANNGENSGNSENMEALLMEAVDKVIPQGENIILESIFGQRKIVKAHIAEMALVEHKIILERD